MYACVCFWFSYMCACTAAACVYVEYVCVLVSAGVGACVRSTPRAVGGRSAARFGGRSAPSGFKQQGFRSMASPGSEKSG